MLNDCVSHAQPVSTGEAGIERCAGYWTPDGAIPRAVAQLVFPFVYDLLQAVRVSVGALTRLGFRARELLQGQRRGFFWKLPRGAVDRAAALVSALVDRGCSIEKRPMQLDEPVLYPLHAKGKQTWLICPEHDDHAPSALINPSGVVYCFACQRPIGVASITPDGALYRRFLRVRAPAPAEVAPAEPARSEGAPAARAVAGGPYSVARVEEAGAPGAPPRVPHTARPTGLVLLLEGEAGERFRTEPMKLGYVLGRRYGEEGATRRSKRGLMRTYSSGRDLLDVLRSAQRQQAGPSAWERGLDAAARHARSGLADHRGFLPDLYVSLDLHAHATTRTIQVAEDRFVVQPEGFTSACGSWVGVDLDGFTAAPVGDGTLKDVAETIRAALERHPCFSGRMGLVRTSERGVQIVAELAETRWDLAGFYHDPHVQRMLAGLDRLCLDVVRVAGFEGGHADPTVHAPGRLVRRPGPRKTKLGTVFVSRLVYATP